jgi:hypothetical protein
MVGLGPPMQRRGQSTPFRLRRQLLGLTRTWRDILKGDGTFDFLAGEDSLVVPADEDADVARSVWRHCERGEDSPLSDERVVGDGYAEAGAAFPHEGIVGIEATARETRDDRLDGCDSRSC